MSVPKVSVIMIFLDPGEFFRPAIESVRQQTFADWELLLVDDGSADGSTLLAREYEQKCSGQIRYVCHAGRRNRGMSASRNRGLRESHGQYIAFLDSDDEWDPQYLATQLQIFEEWPMVAASFGETRTWYSWTGNAEDRLRDRNRKSGPIVDQLAEPGVLIPYWLREEAETPGTCSIVMRREAALRHRFDDHFRGMFEDQVFLYKLALHEAVFVSRVPLAYYRQHPQSACQVEIRRGTYNDSSANRAHLRFLLWLRHYLKQQQPNNVSLLAVLEQQLEVYRPFLLYRFRQQLSSLRSRARQLLASRIKRRRTQRP